MRDLLVVTPSRGRPGRLAEMLAATLGLSQAQTDVAVALDDDDAPAYEQVRAGTGSRVSWHTGPRDTYSGWTNQLAVPAAGDYRAVASLSDDHVPRTPGWDRLLLEAIDGLGGTGFAYGDDGAQRDQLATSVMVSADIVQALGWLTLPACAHYHVDNAWMDLGRGAGCLKYCPDVVIEHLHPFWSKAPMDRTYESEFWRGDPDHRAYQEWLSAGKDGDVATVAALMAGKER